MNYANHTSNWYHNLVMTLYQPFVSEEMGDMAVPRKRAADAMKYIQTIIRIYYLRHGFDVAHGSLLDSLATTGFVCLKAIAAGLSDLELEEARSTLFLVAKGLHQQSKSYYLAEPVFQIIHSQMRPAEAQLFGAIASIDGDAGVQEPKPKPKPAVRSKWPVSNLSKTDDVEAHDLTKLVDQLDRVNMRDEEPLEMGDA